MESCGFVPNKPEDELRIDDLPIPGAAVPGLPERPPVLHQAGATPLRKEIRAQAGIRVQAGQLSSTSFASVFMAAIHITDIEAAINFWRDRKPSPDGVTLAPELRDLAELYALLVFRHQEEADEHAVAPGAYVAWKQWYDSTPDTPCIAVCSTSQGDDICKGCGRSFDEVQRWLAMTPAEKRGTWRRITLQGEAWRFNRYSERTGAGRAASGDA